MNDIEELSCDLLIIGGGAAGCIAAVEARERAPELDVLLVEKAHIYRSGFPRSGDIVHLRAERIAAADKDAGAIVNFVRPRGYFDPPRDKMLFDGQALPGVPAPPPPKPPPLVQKFWLKRAFMRPRTSIFLDGLPATKSSISVPWPLSPNPSPGTVVKL